ncbi:MAG TPA: nuclear transport factor 2 family protein [Solirubrobacterales bacterium]|jgi:ketosteroid isomerase-like protein
MSEENVEIVRKAFDNLNAFLRGELTSEAFSDLIDPQVGWDWHDLPPVPDAPQDLRGAPEVVGFLDQFRSEWVDLATEPLELVEAPDDRVLASTRLSGRGRESGVSIEAHPFQLITIRDGKVRQIEFFRHRAEALEAAGLSE